MHEEEWDPSLLQFHFRFLMRIPRSNFDTRSSSARSIGLGYSIFWILTPLPGTKLYADMEEEGRIEYTDLVDVRFEPWSCSSRPISRGKGCAIPFGTIIKNYTP